MAVMLLTVEKLQISFPAASAKSQACYTKVVDDINLSIAEGETLALVGESGSGKTLTALSVMRLLPAAAKIKGKINFAGQRLDNIPESELCKIRGNDIAMIFQEPLTALNPLHNIEKQLAEPLKLHGKESLDIRIKKLLKMVGLEELTTRLDAYPHQLSGGQRQRVMIAMAMACEPKLLIADEPTTAVDVTVQLQILKLLQRLQQDRGLSIMLITHDLTIVRKIANNVAIMRKGKIIEQGQVQNIFSRPAKSYTKLLLDSQPKATNTTTATKSKPLIHAENITVRFPQRKNFFGKVKNWITAVDGISLTIHKTHILGVVGESGSGKSTLALALLRLLDSKADFAGRVIYYAKDSVSASQAKMQLSKLTGRQFRPLRQQLQIVFQDPFGSLNPRMTIADIITEGLRVHRPDISLAQRHDIAAAALAETGLQADMLSRYPHEFSGGQRQRIAIARAMVLKPDFIVLDEPTSALDLTVQAQIIELLKELQQKHKTSFLFISHDLRVIRALSHDVLVMRAGKMVEYGSAEQIFNNPKNDYTRKLLQAAFML